MDKNDNRFSVGISCHKNMTRAGCDRIVPQPPVHQSQFNGKRVCGYRQGSSFLNAVRPDLRNRCPEGTTPCIPNRVHIREQTNETIPEAELERYLSDLTVVGTVAWKDLKEQAMKPDVKEQEWFSLLTDEEDSLLSALVEAQRDQGGLEDLSYPKYEYLKGTTTQNTICYPPD